MFSINLYRFIVRTALAAVMVAIIITENVQAQSATNGQSGLPLPRFVSLKSEKVNMRIGPGTEFQIAWLYVKKGLPMEVIQEYENWRKVRDPEGNEGWILHSLLSGRRTAIINPWEPDKEKGMAVLYSSATKEASKLARVEPGVMGQVKSCQHDWCEMQIGDVDGYLEKKSIWGVYPDELIEG
ncbi:MAG: SH3 domain-containing protein [Pseudomonadota bacterium]